MVFPGFVAKWKDKVWSDTRKHSIYWYIFSNMRVANVDDSVILAQAALERLCWVYLTNKHAPEMSKKAVNTLSAAEKIRKVLACCKIPADVPAKFSQLTTYAKVFNCADGPQSIVSVRNLLVHPTNDKKGAKFIRNGLFYHEAVSLYLWYAELIMLRLFEYNEKYSNRITAEWVGQVEDVPWAGFP